MMPIWGFIDSSSEEDDPGSINITRRALRDYSNPLELDERRYVFDM